MLAFGSMTYFFTFLAIFRAFLKLKLNFYMPILKGYLATLLLNSMCVVGIIYNIMYKDINIKAFTVGQTTMLSFSGY